MTAGELFVTIFPIASKPLLPAELGMQLQVEWRQSYFSAIWSFSLLGYRFLAEFGITSRTCLLREVSAASQLAITIWDVLWRLSVELGTNGMLNGKE